MKTFLLDLSIREGRLSKLPTSVLGGLLGTMNHMMNYKNVIHLCCIEFVLEDSNSIFIYYMGTSYAFILATRYHFFVYNIDKF